MILNERAVQYQKTFISGKTTFAITPPKITEKQMPGKIREVTRNKWK
jgi:hypothetical protein